MGRGDCTRICTRICTTSSGTYHGDAIHLTMSVDSWTANADGSVSIAANSVDQLYDKLLGVTDWMQLHATLEIGRDKSAFPHVFLIDGGLGNDTKWEAARVAKGLTAGWVTGAQAAKPAELDKVAAEIKKKLKAAKEQHGANV